MAHRSMPTWSIAAAVLLGAGASLLLAWNLEGPRGPAPEVRDGTTLTLDRDALARVDVRLVHEELIPHWIVATGGVKRLQFERLRREAGQDRNLGALLDRMAVLVESDPVLNAQELLALVTAWNEYLAKGRSPWRLAGEVTVGETGGTWLLKSYHVLLDDGRVTVGDRSYRAEIRRRVDPITEPDTWLGHMHDHEDGVIVSLDRVTSFTLDQIWPMLDERVDSELDPLGRRFAAAVRAEVRRALPAADLEALAATGEDRLWLLRAARSVHARHQCGSAFVISRVPWNGLARRELATLQLHVPPVEVSCPEVTSDEVLVFSVRSWHLGEVPGVREALERLVAFVVGAVVVHEARHAADDDALAGQRIACVDCPAGTSHVGALEGSAYLATFADPVHGALSLYQACGLDPELVPDRAAMVEFLAERLVPGGCGSSPPVDLSARAAALERAVFLRSEPIVLTDLPTGLPVSRAYENP